MAMATDTEIGDYWKSVAALAPSSSDDAKIKRQRTPRQQRNDRTQVANENRRQQQTPTLLTL